jgi:hypothetical protein
MFVKNTEFIKQYKEYAKIENSICTFYRKVIGSCSQCPILSFCGTFDLTEASIENVVAILEKWRHKNETNN